MILVLCDADPGDPPVQMIWLRNRALSRDVFECPHPVSPFIMFNSAKEETASMLPRLRVPS